MVVALNKPTKQIWAASESPWSYFRSQESLQSVTKCMLLSWCMLGIIFLPLFFLSSVCVCGQRVASSQIIHKTQASDSTGGKISLPCPCLAWPLSSSWLCSCLPPPPHTQARSLANNMPWWWCNPKKLKKQQHCVCINEWPQGLTLHFCYFYSMSWWGVSENQ
jgi:hypothetical protein